MFRNSCSNNFPCLQRSVLGSIVFLAILLLAASCATIERRSTKIETLIPAEKELPHIDSLDLAIVASIYPDTRSEERLQSGFPNDSLMMITTAFALKSKLEESPKFVGYDFPVFETARTELIQTIQPLTAQRLDNIAIDVNTKYVLSIEYQSVDILYKTGKGYDQDDGLYNYVVASLPYDVMFRLYDTDSKKVIDEKLVTDTLRVRVVQNLYESVEMAMERFPSNSTLILEVARKAGEQYAERVSPNWVEEIRYFFTDNSSEMKLAEQYSEEQDWPHAIEVWMNQVENKDPQKAAAAAFNMAVGCEMIGDYSLALDWLKVARVKDPKYEHMGKQYEKVIKERIEEKIKIDKELN